MGRVATPGGWVIPYVRLSPSNNTPLGMMVTIFGPLCNRAGSLLLCGCSLWGFCRGRSLANFLPLPASQQLLISYTSRGSIDRFCFCYHSSALCFGVILDCFGFCSFLLLVLNPSCVLLCDAVTGLIINNSICCCY